MCGGVVRQLNNGDSAEVGNGDEIHLLGDHYHFKVAIIPVAQSRK